MAVEMASWNIKWNWADKEMTEKETEKVVRENKNKLLVAEQLVEYYDIVSLLEADSNQDAHMNLEGYKMIFSGRNYSSKLYNWNGILLYIKECYNPVVNEEVLKEFETNNSSCFLPVNITINNENINCLFVWTIAKYIKDSQGKHIAEDYYGFNRLYELLSNEGASNFKRAREFIDGSKNNVIIIGDFNMYFPVDRNNIQRIDNWNRFIDLMKDFSLNRVASNKLTFGLSINDYCFVSKSLYGRAKSDVKEKKFGDVVSDHNLLNLTLKL